MQDFEPYFCTVEKCDAPFDLITTFEDLLQHLQDRHVEERFHISLPNGEHQELDEAGIEDYFTQKGGVSEEDLSEIKESTRRKGAYLFDSCPFCGGYPDVLEKDFPDLDAPEAQIQLRRHIKTHMQSMALFFPPYREDAFDNKADARSSILSSVAERAQHSAASQVISAGGLEEPQDFQSVCSTEGCDCKDKGRLSADELAELLRLPASAETDNMSEDADFWPSISPALSRYGYAALTEEDCHEDPILSRFLESDEIWEGGRTVSNHLRHTYCSSLIPAQSTHNVHLSQFLFSIFLAPASVTAWYLKIITSHWPTCGTFQ